MTRSLLVTLAAAALAGCGGKSDTQAAADSTARSIELPRSDSTVALNDRPAPAGRVDTVYLPRSKAPTGIAAPRPAPPPASSGAAVSPTPAPAPAPAPASAPAAPRLEAGTVLLANAVREVSSRRDKVGDTFTAKVAETMTSADGRTVIPAGSEVTFTIAAIKSTTNASPKEASITVRATSIMINGVSHALDADVDSVAHTMKGRGVTGKEAAKVGIGAAAGAIVGKVIGGGGGAAVGGVTGAAAGAAVAVETATKDIVVPVGARIRLVLKSVFSAGA